MCNLPIVYSAVAMVLFATCLSATETQLPSGAECHGKFYAISEYRAFSWREHRVLGSGSVVLEDGESLAFQAMTKSFGNEQFKAIILIPELRHLSLVGTQISDVGLEAALECSWLKSVNIWSCPKVSNKGVESFKNCKDIYSFSLGATNSVDDGWLEHLANWPKLTELRVDGTPVTGRGFKYFAHTPLLERIEGFNVYKLEDEGLTHVSKLPSLRSLELWECKKTTSVGMSKLAGC